MAVRWIPSRTLFAILIPAAILVASAGPRAQAPDAAAILTAAREAIGGDGRVRAVKSLRLTGTTFSTQAVVSGFTQDTEEPLELRFALPDRFLQISLLTTRSASFESRVGFVADRTISVSNGKPTDTPGQSTYIRKVAAELLLMLLARTEPWGGLTLEAVGPSALSVKGPDGYAARLEFDPATRRLQKLTYRQRRQVRPRNTILRRDEILASAKERDTGGQGGRSAVGASGRAGDLPEIEIAITFHDYRRVDGILLPHRITTTAVDAGALLWELRFEKIAVNPPLTDADFKE
jgi:hypothetical protein